MIHAETDIDRPDYGQPKTKLMLKEVPKRAIKDKMDELNLKKTMKVKDVKPPWSREPSKKTIKKMLRVRSYVKKNNELDNIMKGRSISIIKN